MTVVTDRSGRPVRLVTVVGAYAGVMPAMLDHYSAMGVGQSVVCAHGVSCDDPMLADIACIAADRGATVTRTVLAPWHFGVNTILYANARSAAPDSWFVLADQDELQVYPDGLAAAIEYCEKRGYDYIEGCLVDRVTTDGSLPAVRSDMCIWSQFPLGGLITGVLLKGVINKIVAAKGHVRLSHGQHQALSGRGCPPNELYVPVHHFKWVSALFLTLGNRIASNAEYSAECRRLVAHYDLDGRLPIEEPALFMSRCEPSYPHWEMLKQWRVVAHCFSRELAHRLNYVKATAPNVA